MSFFGELYLRSTRPFLDAEITDREARFIASTLQLAPGSQVLDLGCGHGRHQTLLVSRGTQVVGLDVDRLSLKAMLPGLLRACGDFWALPFGACFDAAYAWYATLFIREDDAENRAALAEAARVLKPGARLLVHNHNPSALAAEPTSRFETDLEAGGHLVERTWFDAERNLLRGHRTLALRDRLLEGTFTVRCPTVRELRDWAREAGLSLERTYGDISGARHRARSPDLIALFFRR